MTTEERIDKLVEDKIREYGRYSEDSVIDWLESDDIEADEFNVNYALDVAFDVEREIRAEQEEEKPYTLADLGHSYWDFF